MKFSFLDIFNSLERINMDSKDTFFQQFPGTLKQNIQDITKAIRKATEKERDMLRNLKKEMLFLQEALKKAKEGGI